jgi:hypothetical protein
LQQNAELRRQLADALETQKILRDTHDELVADWRRELETKAIEFEQLQKQVRLLAFCSFSLGVRN